jgi:hypothetical protein
VTPGFRDDSGQDRVDKSNATSNEINDFTEFYPPPRNPTDTVRLSTKGDDMDFRPTSDEERAWWRIVASLLAFAGLAERAAYHSMPVRWLVLSILRLAEAVVEDVVLDAAGLPQSDADDLTRAGQSPEDALALAARFLALAAMLAGLIRATNWHDRWPSPRRPAFAHIAPCQLACGLTRPPYDTS